MRPSIDFTMVNIAVVLSRRATCSKLSVGCVLTDSRGRIIGTGYNGVPHGMLHCTDCACGGADKPKGSDSCIAVHAEINALLSCADIQKIRTCYTTHAPCLQCTKTLLNSDCQRIVFREDAFEAPAKALWVSTGRRWEQIGE